MPIVRNARRVAALLALTGFLIPGASAAVVALHLSAHHAGETHEEHHDDAPDLSVLWHGHGHDATTPDHDHPLLLGGMQGLRIPALEQAAQAAPGLWHPAVLGVAAAARVRRSCPPGLAGLGPPPLPPRMSILRI